MPLSLTWIALALALLAVVAGVHELGARIHPWGPALGLALVSVAAFGLYRAALPSLARWALDRRERLLTQLKMPGGERMGMLMRACRSGLILLTGVALVSCMPSRMYRPVSVVPGPDYTMTYLELDEQGELWAPEQLSRILNQIEQANKQESGALVMLFIHGWHHNASPKDEQPDSGNITGFKRLISKTIALARESDPDWSRPVIGIYVGWRGESIRLPILKSFSFWNRGRAAKRIAGVTATEVLAKILATSAGNPDTVSLLVGHSFGGRILEKAVAQALVGGLVGHEAEEIDYPVSAIILVNPASQSILAKQLVEAFERDRTKIYSTDPKGRTYERPLMVSVTSAGDTATRVLFPAGLTVASLGKKFRRYGDAYCTPLPRQRSFYRKTAGHHSALHSHVVTAEPLSDDDRESDEGMGGVLDYRTSRDPVTGQRVFSFQGEKHRFSIQKKRRTLNDSPYWIMQVPRSLIPNHSTIFGESTVRLIATILTITGALEPEVTTRVVRERGILPVKIFAIPDGGMGFVDRVEGLYRIPEDGGTLEFTGCPPGDFLPSEWIGLYVAEGRAVVSVVSRQVDFSDKPKYRTEINLTRFKDQGVEYEKLMRYTGPEHFVAAAVDRAGRRAFLTPARPPVVYVADLQSNKKPVPTPWVELEESASISSLHYDQTTDQLYATDGLGGRLFAVDTKSPDPRPQVVAQSLGVPTRIAGGPTGERLYVADSEGLQVWSIDCAGVGECSTPEVFVRDEAFSNLSDLVVAPDGTVWVGDIEAQRIFGFNADGQLEQMYAELPPH